MGKNNLYFKLILVGMIGVVGCTKLPYPRGESVVIGLPQSPVSLDPRLAGDAEGQKISDLLYDGLVMQDDQQNFHPLLAESWEEVAPLKFLFTLKKGILFTNGEELTTKDLLCTYQFIQNPDNASVLRGEFEKIAAITALDDYHVTIELKEAYAPFFLLLKKGIVSCDGKSGTGLYTVEAFQPERRLVLKANPKHFTGLPQNKFLVFEVVKDDTTRVLKLLNHELDLVLNGVPPMLLEKILMKKGLQSEQREGTTFAYLGLNLRDPMLKQQKVREALAHAIDVEAIIRHLWKGTARSADSLLSPTHWAYHSPSIHYPLDIAKAKRLLDEAGLKDPDGDGPKPRLSLTLKTSTVKARIEIAKMIAAQLEKIGIAVSVTPHEWGTFFSDIKSGNFQLYTSTWVGVTEPDLYFNILHSSQIPPAGSNRGFYSNPRMDQLVTAGRGTLAQTERAAIYRAVQEMVARDLPFLSLWYEDNVAIYWDDLKGVRLSPAPNYRNFAEIAR